MTTNDHPYLKIFTLLLVTIVLTSYIALKFQELVNDRYEELTELKEKVEALKKEQTSLEKRCLILENEVYYNIYPMLEDKRRPVTSSEAWQRNWYENHRRRLESLERRLLKENGR